jgi:penicillin-insensitive murein endopeptidase
LTGAVELPVSGPGYARLRPHSPNYFGNPRLVFAIQQAAAAVDKQFPGGSPLLVGDISARRGGKIPNHRSHRTGRDVDFLWYVTTPSGAPVRNPGWLNLGTDELAHAEGGEFVRLDVPRQWAFFKELLLSTEIEVQFLFVSRGVEAAITEYARARGEPPELVWRAVTVMLEPGDSSPHDCHVHLRIACRPDEAVAGCEGGGPYWPWLPERFTEELGPEQYEALALEDPPSWLGEVDGEGEG